MQGNDHATLAHFLINQLPSPVSLRHKTAFIIGCIEPDLNPFTYMRGSIRHRFMHGHNAENAKEHIRKCLDKMQNNIPESKFDYFTLGTMIHYIADSFTFAHNQAFTGTMKDHIAYEKRLNPIFFESAHGY